MYFTPSSLPTSCTFAGLFLQAKVEPRSITNKPGTRDRSVTRSSVIPSLKYSCCGSPLRLVNGITAIDGMLGSGNAGFSDGGIDAEDRGGFSDRYCTSTTVATKMASPAANNAPLRRDLPGIRRVARGTAT